MGNVAGARRVSDTYLNKIAKLRSEGLSYFEISKIVGKHPNSVEKVLNKYRPEATIKPPANYVTTEEFCELRSLKMHQLMHLIYKHNLPHIKLYCKYYLDPDIELPKLRRPLTNDDIEDIMYLRGYEVPLSKIARRLGFHRSTVEAVVKDQEWR